MKAVQVAGYGDTDQLKVVDMPIPEPKDDEVLVKVKACAINNTEIWMREGAYGTDEKSGWRPEGFSFRGFRDLILQVRLSVPAARSIRI